MTVSELLARCSSKEIQEWKVLTKIEQSEAQQAQQAASQGF